MWIPKALWTLLTELRQQERQALEDERGRVERMTVIVQGMRSAYESQVAALRVGHAAAIARADRAENELARSKATIEWMATQLNATEMRASRLEHLLFATNPNAMQIDTSKMRGGGTTPAAGEMTGTSAEDERFSELLQEDSIQALFEDIGDKRAQKAGLGWDEAGTVVETRG